MVVYAAQHPDPPKASASFLARCAALHWGLQGPLPLARGPYGKPYLPHHPQHHFNLSHSGTILVCAMDDAPVGVDVQLCQPRRKAFLDKLCTPEERQWLRERSDSGRAFALFWSLKESRCKWSGRGLQRPISDIHIPLPQTDEDRLGQDGLIFSLHSGEGWQLCLCSTSPWNGEIQWLSQFEDTEE